MNLQHVGLKRPCYQVEGWLVDPLSMELVVARLEDKESIINGISDALMVLDAKTYKIREVNNSFLNIYKTTFDQVIGNTCYKITHHECKPCSQIIGHEICPLEKSVSTGELSVTEHEHKDQDGNNRYFEITCYPINDIHGEVSHLVHLSRDVTDRRLAEESLKEKVTRSEHLAALGQLVAEITHEIKNPLMMIGGFARQLFQPVDKETKVKKLTIITEEVERLEKLLTGIRDLYQQKPPIIQDVNVKRILDKLYSLVKDEAAKKNIRTELIMDKNDLIVKWDPQKLEQVLLNFIKNSMEAMEKGGNLSIRAKSSGKRVQIDIIDNGCGISKEHMERILECFFSTKKKGTGLGLCISKKYIDEHDGSDFFIESVEGKGTAIKINLTTSTFREMRNLSKA